MITGYTDALPHDCLLDTGVLFVGAAAIGASRGGLKFEPKKTLKQIEFDGKRSDIVGNDRVTKFEASITGKFFQFGAADLVRYEPDATSASASGVLTITPKRAGVLYSAGSYLTDVRLLFERAGSTDTTPLYAAAYFPKAIITKYDLVGKDNDEAEISLDIMARLDMSAEGAQINDAPYKIELRTTEPA